MAGWFPETSDEKKVRLVRDRNQAISEVKRQKRAEKRRAQKAEFQKAIDAEVERYMENLSPNAKKERLDKMQGQSSLMNTVLGQEFSYRGSRTATPWMKSPGLEMGIGRAKVQKGEEIEVVKGEDSVSNFKSPKLCRPY